MKKLVVISLLGVSTLLILSGCRAGKTKTVSRSHNETQQLQPKVSKKKETVSESVKDTKKTSDKENRALLTQFFTAFAQFDSKKTPAYQRAQTLLKWSNEEVVNYLIPNVLGAGESAAESVAYTQTFISPLKITPSASGDYQYDVSMAYTVKVGQNENKYKQVYSVILEDGKVSVVKDAMTLIYNPDTKTYE